MSVDVERTRNESRGRWHGIYNQLGIDVGIGKHQPCPYCAGTNRFRLTDKDGLGGYFCNQCGAGDGFSLIMKVFGIGFIDAVKKVSELIGVVEMDFKLDKPKKDPSIYLNRVWKESLELRFNDTVRRYLQSREIPSLPDDVRYHPVCYESDTKLFYQAMVARITSKAGKPIGLHVTYLKDGRKADVPSPKKMLTPTESLEGSAIRLAPVYEIMGIAEGIETALSCTKLFDIPTWSCMTAGLMEKWTPPEECKRVVVFSDNDYSYTGQKSAYRLANKLYLSGYMVDVRIPPSFGDYNDVLRTRGEKGCLT